MKKIKVLLTAFVVTALTLTSCSSDDSSGTPASIEGKWNQTKTVVRIGNQPVTQQYDENEEGCTKNYIEFAAGQVYNDVVYFKQNGVCNENTATPGTWSKNDDTLVITNGGIFTGTYEISRLTNSELRIVSESNEGGISTETTVFFTKAN